MNRVKWDEGIKQWLEEDIGYGDLTGDAVMSPDLEGRAWIQAKEAGTMAGLPVAKRVFYHVDPDLQFLPSVHDGDEVAPGTVVAELSGRVPSIVKGERVALNVLQRLSGIATATRRYVNAVAGTKAEIVDTRKTTPGMRMFEKYAVRMGGGRNHRFGLFDAVMIKENHIRAAGGISPAVSAAQRQAPHTAKIEVETESLREVKEALQAGTDIIMLDNMTPSEMEEAVRTIDRRASVEASGGITLENVRQTAETGVDWISVGALTHSVKALDLSLYVRNES